MRFARGLTGLVVMLTWATDLSAQVVLYPVPYGGSYIVGPGLGVFSPRRGVVISRFLPASRVTVYYHAPRPVVLAPLSDELAGVDLDEVKPPRPTVARAELVPEPLEPALPGREVSVPRRPIRPDDAEPARKPRPEPPAAPKAVPPKEEPLDESGRLVQLGLAAFAQKEHGLAAQRFQQAAAADPQAAKPHFLLAQALFALGKYREAADAIHSGMRLKPGWPHAPFRPRRDLYQGNEDDLDTHVRRLENVAAEHPDNARFLFLLGYELWFDGRRAEAVPLFQRARVRAGDSTYLDEFLKAAPAGPVAFQ
jgi:hypothetical protein